MLEIGNYFAELVVVVGLLVTRHAQPVHRSWSNSGVGILLDDLFVELLCLGPLLVHESHARQTHQEVSVKFVLRQIALDAKTLFAVLVKNEDGWRPEDVKTVKACRVFFDMDGRGDETFLDELLELGIGVRFGFQPNATGSSRSGAEIEQHGTVLGFRLAERSVNILDPIDRHEFLLFKICQLVLMQWKRAGAQILFRSFLQAARNRCHQLARAEANRLSQQPVPRPGDDKGLAAHHGSIAGAGHVNGRHLAQLEQA